MGVLNDNYAELKKMEKQIKTRELEGKPIEPASTGLGVFARAKKRRELIEKRRLQHKQIYAQEYQKASVTAVKQKARRDAMKLSMTTGERVSGVLRSISDLGSTLQGPPVRKTSVKKKQKKKPVGKIGFSLTEGFDDDIVGF